MDNVFKAWLINRFENQAPADRLNFLRRVKFDPEGARSVIAANLIHWGTEFVMAKSVWVVCRDNLADSQELLAACQQHFAAELAALE